jgi:hypothetical protein
VRGTLSTAELVIASVLTLVECDRTILRAQVAGRVSEAEAADRRARLIAAGEGDPYSSRLDGDERAGLSSRPAPWMRFSQRRMSPSRISRWSAENQWSA